MISVIVPVYKTEKLLSRCVNSILNQTYSDLEVILVDDGSPDNCPELCDEIAAMDKRVKVIHQKNAGVSVARNSGLQVATGEYITFVDSDDYIESDMYEKMLTLALEKDCDVVMCDCIKEFSTYTEIYSHHIRGGYYSRAQLETEYFPHLLMMENVEYPATISNCLLLFRRNLKSGKKLPQYVEGVRFSEDLLFGAQLLYAANSFYYMKGMYLYHYCMNENSATHVFKKDKWKDYLKLHTQIEASFLQSTVFSFDKQIHLTLLFFVYNAVGDIISAELKKDEKLNLLNEILTNEKVKQMFQNISIWRLPISYKLKVLTLLYKYRIGLRVLIARNE